MTITTDLPAPTSTRREEAAADSTATKLLLAMAAIPPITRRVPRCATERLRRGCRWPITSPAVTPGAVSPPGT